MLKLRIIVCLPNLPYFRRCVIIKELVRYTCLRECHKFTVLRFVQIVCSMGISVLIDVNYHYCWPAEWTSSELCFNSRVPW